MKRTNKKLAVITAPIILAGSVVSPFSISASAEGNGFTLTYNGDIKELVASEDKFFEISDAMPGDIIGKEIAFSNSNKTEINAYFKINDEGIIYTPEQTELAKKTSLLVTMETDSGLQVIYNDNIYNALASQRTSAIELGTLAGNSTSQLKFEVTIPKSLNNTFSLTSLNLKWEISSEDSYSASIEDPVITPKTKNFTGAATEAERTVTITCPTAGSKIYYTIDGSEPSLDSPVYTGPFVIDKSNMTVKAKAFLTSDITCKSNTITEKYTITASAPSITPESTTFKGSSSDKERTITISYPSETEIVRYTTDGTDPDVNSPIYEGPFVLNQNATIKAKAWLKYDETCQSDIVTESYKIICDKPIIDPPSRKYYTDETPGSVIIMCDTPDAEIHYTTDGTIPTEASPIYTEPFPIDKDMTVKAIATKRGVSNSDVASESYQINVPLPQSEKPIISPKSGLYDTAQTITITCPDINADIFYTTDGSTPTLESEKYTGTFIVDENTTVKAIALAPRHTISEITQEDYQIRAPKPNIKPNGDLYDEEVLVKITCSDPNAEIHYTTNGKTPTADSPIYTKPFVVDENTTVKAITVVPNKEISHVAKEDYEIKTEAPSITPDSGTYNGEIEVKITCPDTEAEIFYTIDGSTPTDQSPKYTKPFKVSKSAVVKAIAINPNKSPSDERLKNYIINSELISPTITPESGEYEDLVTVRIKDNNDVENVIIRYTTDGSNPTEKSPIYKAPFVVDKNATVKAIAQADGYNDSERVEEKYTIKLSTPTITPDSGTYKDEVTITIVSNVKDAVILYSIDDSEPSIKYTGPFKITSDTKITAIATKDGVENSDPIKRTYIFEAKVIPEETQEPAKTGVEAQKKSKLPAYIAIGIAAVAAIIAGALAIIKKNKKKNKDKGSVTKNG